MEDHHHLPETLKPFFHRATEAQVRDFYSLIIIIRLELSPNLGFYLFQ